MKILRQFKDTPNIKDKISIEDAIEQLDGSYYKKGTVKEMLEGGLKLQSSFAYYEKSNQGGIK